jgi:hypothetical protein
VPKFKSRTIASVFRVDRIDLPRRSHRSSASIPRIDPPHRSPVSITRIDHPHRSPASITRIDHPHRSPASIARPITRIWSPVLASRHLHRVTRTPSPVTPSPHPVTHHPHPRNNWRATWFLSGRRTAPHRAAGTSPTVSSPTNRYGAAALRPRRGRLPSTRLRRRSGSDRRVRGNAAHCPPPNAASHGTAGRRRATRSCRPGVGAVAPSSAELRETTLPVDATWEVFFLFRNEDTNDGARPRGRDRSWCLISPMSRRGTQLLVWSSFTKQPVDGGVTRADGGRRRGGRAMRAARARATSSPRTRRDSRARALVFPDRAARSSHRRRARPRSLAPCACPL